MFGRILEQLWGSKKMLIFYTVTGLGAAFIHLTVNYIQMNHLIEYGECSLHSHQIMPPLMTLLQNTATDTALVIRSPISCRNGFTNPMIFHLLPRRLKKLYMRSIAFNNLVSISHRWGFWCGIRTADCFCHDIPRCGTHADLPSYSHKSQVHGAYLCTG